MQYRELFGVPMYRAKFDQHEELKASFLEFLKDEELYKRNTTRQSLQFTHPNLHKEKLFSPFVDFVNSTLALAFEDMGYIPSFELTGLWSTKHPTGGYHHYHTHHNSFLAGVYYLDGDETSAGTSFENPCKLHNIIHPAKIPNSIKKPSDNYISPFEEGTLIIFPAWLSHSTAVNSSNNERVILSFNSMPVGMTTNDEFDRYNYQSIKEAEMINFVDQRVKTKRLT